jgi:hypothetical protein
MASASIPSKWSTHFENANPTSLFRFADAATGRMDAGAEAAGVHGRGECEIPLKEHLVSVGELV